MRIVAVDIETTVKDGKRASPYYDDILAITINDGDEIRFSTDPAEFEDILDDPGILKVFQNGAFDIQFLEHNLFGLEVSNIWDTMIAERVLTAGRGDRCDLGTIVSKYRGVNLNKSIRDSFHDHRGELTTTQVKYAKDDVRYLIDVYRQQEKEIGLRGMSDIMRIENELVPVMARMELRGVGFDPKVWEDILVTESAIVPKLEKELQLQLSSSFTLDLFGGFSGGVNLNSPKQLTAALSRLGVRLESTNVESLKRCGHPVAKMILNYRDHAKRLQWDYPQYVNSVTGRIHPDFNQTGAATGRLSCSDPNMQQVPKDPLFRSMFSAPPGYRLITIDYSQQELRVLAELCKDPNLIKACKTTDVHLENARMLYKDPSIQKSDKRRSTAKNSTFAMVYRAGAKTFASAAGITLKESKKFLGILHKTYSGVFKWGDESFTFLRQHGYTATLGGRRRYFPGVMVDPNKYMSAASNTPVQGSSADMMKLAMIYVHQGIKDYDAGLVLSVHDEVVVEVNEEQLEEVVPLVCSAMQRAGEYYVKVVPVNSEYVVANTWTK